jgi:hypothetical protein
MSNRRVASSSGAIREIFSSSSAATYRAHEDRELGFRRGLRSEFHHFDVDDRVNPNDESHYSCRHMMEYITEHGRNRVLSGCVWWRVWLQRLPTFANYTARPEFLSATVVTDVST